MMDVEVALQLADHKDTGCKGFNFLKGKSLIAKSFFNTAKTVNRFLYA